jgi:hypothetical protein
MFEKQVDYFMPGYMVITWDVPLHGLSRPYKDFTYHNAAIDLKSILDTEGIEKYAIRHVNGVGEAFYKFSRSDIWLIVSLG